MRVLPFRPDNERSSALGSKSETHGCRNRLTQWRITFVGAAHISEYARLFIGRPK